MSAATLAPALLMRPIKNAGNPLSKLCSSETLQQKVGATVEDSYAILIKKTAAPVIQNVKGGKVGLKLNSQNM